MTAPAVFLGIQPGFRHIAAIELYNLLAPVGEHPPGSTVSKQTLLRHGFSVPRRSKNRNTNEKRRNPKNEEHML